jgi:hypothetical protein
MMSVDLARLLSQLTVIAGVVILLMPQTLNYIVAAYLILTVMVGFGSDEEPGLKGVAESGRRVLGGAG